MKENKFLTTVHSEDIQIMYAYTVTREDGLSKALAYIAGFDDTLQLRDTLVIEQHPNI